MPPENNQKINLHACAPTMSHVYVHAKGFQILPTIAKIILDLLLSFCSGLKQHIACISKKNHIKAKYIPQVTKGFYSNVSKKEVE